MTWLYVLSSLGVFGMGIAIWWYRRRALAGEAAALRAAADLVAAQKAAADELERHNDALRSYDGFADRLHLEVEAMVRRHPDLAGEYRDIVVRLASGTSGAGVATLPIQGAAAAVGGGG